MLKNKTVLEVKIGERLYELSLDASSPIGEVFDALSQMQSFVVQKINESQPKKEEESKIVELPTE